MGNQTSTMGNQNQNQNQNQKEQSSELKPKNISQIIDYIATYYILTMDFTSLRKMYNKEYCDKLVILTSDIIERYFTDMEITYLAKRVENGINETNGTNEKNETNETKENFTFFPKEDMDKLDIQNSFKKKRVCISISKFYIKIAHIFAAIVMTINPIYVYKDVEGNTIKTNLYKKGQIPPNTPRNIYKLNICDSRINALKGNQDFNVGQSENITIHPKVCSINTNDIGENKSLMDEPGIPELEELYFDDNYDYETGEFKGMSNESKKSYEEDLKIFYNIFSDGSSSKTPITKFSDIKLKDYSKMPECNGANPILNEKMKGNLSNNLFAQYADNLNKMVRNANKNQEALLEILNQLFVYSINPQTNEKQIRVHPKLSEKELQNIVIKTRAIIIKLYLTCEIDYTNGVKIYEAIVEKKILDTVQLQEKNLKNLSKTLIQYEDVPLSSENQKLE